MWTHARSRWLALALCHVRGRRMSTGHVLAQEKQQQLARGMAQQVLMC